MKGAIVSSIINVVDRKTKRPDGRKRIDFFDDKRVRRSIYLGKISQRRAERIGLKIDAIISAKTTRDAFDDETAHWLAGISERLADKLVKVGLIGDRHSAGPNTLAAFLDGYIASRGEVKGSTATVYGHTRRCLIGYFGASKPLHAISEGDAEEWRRWLAAHEHLSENTIRRRCGIAKQFFRFAVRKRVIRESPFANMKGCGARENKSRLYFVSREEAQRVIEACPDAQWRLLFALSRYGGLRCPSEHLGLRWGDVAWDRERFTVHSPKTEHHADGGIRRVPIFSELRPYLEEVFEQAEPGTEYVITRYRDAGTNLRTQLQRIIRRAGLIPWPKLFQNLRSTRETELAEDFPIHVVCAWIGNSRAVAQKHYLQVTDEHFEQGAHAQRNTQQQPAAMRCKPMHAEDTDPAKTRVCSVLHSSTSGGVGGTELEPATSTV
jgi:integrase